MQESLFNMLWANDIFRVLVFVFVVLYIIKGCFYAYGTSLMLDLSVLQYLYYILLWPVDVIDGFVKSLLAWKDDTEL